MSMTDLERELRATLTAAGDQAPIVDDLASRVVRPVRRRRARMVVGAAAAVAVAIAAVVTAVLVVAGSGDRTDPPVATSTPGPAAALIGTWRPLDIVGYHGQLPRSGSSNADITLTADGRWAGSDGCNGLGGTYTATDDGAITVRPGGGGTTDVWCANVPNGHVLVTAARFTIRPIRDSADPSLTFYAANGQRLATYQHP